MPSRQIQSALHRTGALVAPLPFAPLPFAPLLFAPLLLVVAGCGGAVSKYIPKPVNAVFSVTPSARTIDTNGKLRMKATAASGAPAAVKWSVLGGDNDPSLGEGAIDDDGNYTPPAALTRDSIQVELQAQLRSDPRVAATEVIAVTPSFLQPLTPENSTLAAGASVEVTAQLAEVGGGAVRWQLAASPSGGRRLGSAYGTFSQQSCQRSPRDYTVCSAVYTAPAALPDSEKEVYVIASAANAAGATEASRLPLHILFSDSGSSSTPLANQSAQASLVQLGASGGNNNDADTSDSANGAFINDCCGGTLGALVRDEIGGQYILSDNHVLAESDQARIGDAIVQPALIDRNCDQNAGRSVATLRYAVPLASPATNSDAALAEVNAGTVDPTGAILQLGASSAGANGSIGAAPPAAGLGQAPTPELFAPDSAPLLVAKSGRTTGLTCSTIDAIDLSVEVDYYKDCAETQPYYRKTFSGQLGISGAGFSDSGDSGALVVNAANAEPLGLYFAGGAGDNGLGLSIATPIQDVLRELDAEAGHQFSIVGGAEHPVACLNYDRRTATAEPIPEGLRKKADAAIRKGGATLVNPALGVLELAAGASSDAPGAPAIIVYVDKAKENVAVPQTIAGLRTVVVPADQASLNAGAAPAPKPNDLAEGIRLPAAVLESAQQVQHAYAAQLMADPAFFGVGVTQSRDNPAEAALLVLVDPAQTPLSMPAVVGGLRTRYLAMRRFHVTKSKYAAAPHPSSCALRSAAARTAPQAPRSGMQTFDPQNPIPALLP